MVVIVAGFIPTDNGQKYSDASNILYIFHVKQQFPKAFDDKHFENIQAEHATELISFEIQCFDSIFVDKLFKSVFK